MFQCCKRSSLSCQEESMRGVVLLLGCVLTSLGLAAAAGSTYYIGVGRYDITGPSVQIEMMGYAMPTQIGKGIHLRQYSRAFIFADQEKKSRVVFVNIDACMGTQIMKMQVVERLQKKYGNDTYTHDNVLISGIHTHSGPAGYFQYLLFEIMSLGFVGQTLEAIVDGIVQSIELAHEDMREGFLYVGNGTLEDASINRSPSAYLNNPEEERKLYKNDTDKEMVVLKILDTDKKPIGMIDWFAVHCTSMNNTNRLISSDNKGLASLMMEKAMNKGDYLPGRGPFVAAFAQSNEGDVSPNTKGPHCQDTGKECDFYHSTCNGKNELCVAPGPGKDIMESTKIIATKQYVAGKGIYDNAPKIELSGPVKYAYTNVDFSNLNVTLSNGSKVHTCPPAMGRSFAAGTIDGPGAFNFEQGDTNTSNRLWNTIRNLLHKPSPEQIKCQAPKPILLDTGDMNFPYPWQGKVLPLQLLQIGQLVIIGVPAEFTTMSGRRTRNAVLETLKKNGYSDDTVVVIAGLSNTYSDYVATYEEYQVQRYEGASTAYGPHTLSGYIQEYVKLADDLANNKTPPAGPKFPNYLDQQWSLHEPIIFDAAPSGKFGAIVTDAKSSYKVGETVTVVFHAGNPRNCLMTNETYLTVQLKEVNGSWKTLYTDASWETKFEWEQTNLILGHSKVTISWDIPSSADSGTYRIQHFGYHKPTGSDPKPYNGTSSDFKVTSS